MSAPRIDTFRRTLDAVTALLEEVRPEVEDIHDLAYNRNRAAGDAKVAGGSRDFALDTHGDMVARELYIDVAAQLVGLGRGAERALRSLRRHLNKSDSALSRDASADVTAAEFAQAQYARTRRTERGERHPHRVFAEGERKHTIDPVAELEHLRTAVRRLAARADLEHTGCRDDNGRRKQKWLDRSILSPAQRTAIDRAIDASGQAQAS